jgi:hypothetical protein
MSNEDLLTPAAAGKLFNPPVSGDWIRRLCDRGDLRAVRTTKGWRLVPASEVARLLKQRAESAAAHAAAVAVDNENRRL